MKLGFFEEVIFGAYVVWFGIYSNCKKCTSVLFLVLLFVHFKSLRHPDGRVLSRIESICIESASEYSEGTQRKFFAGFNRRR